MPRRRAMLVRRVPASLHDRAADCWRPLLAIADLIGGDWPMRARTAAFELSGTEPEDAEAVVELLRDISEYLSERDAEVIPSSDLAAWLIARPDRPWATWRGGRLPLTERGLARLLGPLGIHPAQYRTPAGVRRGYRKTAWTDAMARYLPSHAVQRDSARDDGPLSHIGIRDSDSECHTCDLSDQPSDTGLCHAVTHRSEASGQSERGGTDADDGLF